MFKRDNASCKEKKTKVVKLFAGEREDEFVCVLDIFRSWCKSPGYWKVIVAGFTNPTDAWEYVHKQKELPPETEVENAKVRLLGARACRKDHLCEYVAPDERYKYYNISEVA